MTQLYRFPLTGSPDGQIVVEVDDDPPGVARAGRDQDGIARAAMTFEAALQQVRDTAEAVLNQLTTLAPAPNEVEVEFGVRLSGEVGAIVARTCAEGNLTVRLTWRDSPESPR